ncbi:ALF repeat-containing protein [Kitasatospora sp. NPDC004289]
MNIRRSLATAVLLATAAAPLATTAPAFAEGNPAPAGQEQADDAGTKLDQENTAAIKALLVWPNDYLFTEPSDDLRERVAEVLAGTPEDRANFLAKEAPRIRVEDARVAIARISEGARNTSPILEKAAEAAFRSRDDETMRVFLKTGQYVARTEDENRAKLQKIIDDPATGWGVREGARKALAGTAADVEKALNGGLSGAAEHDDRILLMQILSVGGPAVRDAANKAMSGTIEDVRRFLKVGQHVARAEDENRAKLQKIIDDPATGWGVREGARKALAGSAADVEKALNGGLSGAAEHDDRILLSNIMYRGGPAVQDAANKAMSGTIEDVRRFLKEGQYVARAEDEGRAELRRLLEDPQTGPHVRKGAAKALAGTAADVEKFLKEGLATLRDTDDLVLITQIASNGGPEVRKAADAAFNSGSLEQVRAFLKEGQYVARAKDEANAKAAAEAEAAKNRPATGTTVVTPATDTTRTTTTGTVTDGQPVAGGRLAYTGTDAPLGQIGAAGAAAVALGAGALIATRRRTDQS